MGPPGLGPLGPPGLAPGGAPLPRTMPRGRGPPLPRIGEPGVGGPVGGPGGLCCIGDPGRGTCMPGCMAWGGGLRRLAGLARRTPSPEVPATGMGAVLARGDDPGAASLIMLELTVAGCSLLPRG